MSDSEGEPGLSLDSVFIEPPRPPTPEPTFAIYERGSSSSARQEHSDDLNWSTVKIRLVGSHPLWGHHLWNASRAFASYLDEHPELYRGRAILELGAGGGLPGIVAAKNGAEAVVLTDYPDAALVENLSYNVNENISPQMLACVHVKGYIWGQPVRPLLDLLPASALKSSRNFDLIVLSDLIFNHSQHDVLLQACEQTISQQPIDRRDNDPEVPSHGNIEEAQPCVLVFYTHHRPHLAHRDMEFFAKARLRGWTCEEILTRRFPPMFPDDPGEEEVRATVHGWRLTRSWS